VFTRAAAYANNKLSTQKSALPEVQVLNNLSWLKDVNLLDFLRTTGIHFRMNRYDFYELYKTRGCTIQLGGSDQWGNILSGVELINKAELGGASDAAPAKEKGFALTTPLLTTSTGEKFGKSAGNAVWLDKNLTSYLDFYQALLTLLPVEEISSVMQDHQSHPEHRIAQYVLAEEVTLMVQGEAGLNAARVATQVLFGTEYSTLKGDQIIESLSSDPRLVFCSEEEMFDTSLPNLVATHKLASSKSAARQLVQAGGLYLNNITQRDPQFRLTRDVLVDGKVAIVRAGKDKHLVLALH
ncbi:hypothetical protein HYDPIDRAFT_117962, partial [Hydnomerulius pinastri MD-312]